MRHRTPTDRPHSYYTRLAIAADRQQQQKMEEAAVADKFVERMVKSATDRRKAAARMAAERLKSNAEQVLRELDRGDIPNIDLVGDADKLGRALSDLVTIREITEVYATQEVPAE